MGKHAHEGVADRSLTTVPDAYIISWTLIGSIILYPSGIGMRYIDALFFGASAATTSGLNT